MQADLRMTSTIPCQNFTIAAFGLGVSNTLSSIACKHSYHQYQYHQFSLALILAL